MAHALASVHETDPRQEIMDALSPTIDQMEVMGARVLLGVYVRSSTVKTASGTVFHLPDSARDEDKYQGKVGLVLKMGPLAFTEDATHKWGGCVPKIGDWVHVQVYETKPFEAMTTQGFKDNNHRCRFVEDVDILAVLKQPDIVR